MPALKLTKDIFHKLPNEAFVRLWENDKSMLMTELQRLLELDNAKQQVDLLKKVVKEVRETLKSEGTASGTQALEFLVHIFFICTTKNPLRRVLISTFQNLPDTVQSVVVKPAIVNNLTTIITEWAPTLDSPISFEQAADLRHSVDTFAAVTENFQLGVESVNQIAIEMIDFLSSVNLGLYQVYSPVLSPVQQNEVMHHCLEAVKLINRVIQKTEITVATRLDNKPEEQNRYTNIVKRCICTDIEVLKTDEFLLDYKTTSAMNICLMLKHSEVQDNVLPLFLKTVFKHLDWLPCPQVQTPDWLIQIQIDRLSKSRLSSSAYLCFCYGLLAMVTMDNLLEGEGRCFLLDGVLPECLEHSKICTDVGSKLLAAKSICLLIQRLREYIESGGIVSSWLASKLHGDSRNMQNILDFVFTAWEDSVEAIRYTVRDIFQHLVQVHLACKEHKDSVQDDSFLCQLSHSILHDVSWSCKGKYGTLSVLIGHVGSTRMLQWYDGIAREVLKQLCEQTLACYASELYEKLFNCHLLEITEMNQSGETSEQTNQSEKSIEEKKAWFNEWVKPVLEVLCYPGNTLQKKHTIEYVLPRLLKTGKQTFRYMITTLTNQLAESDDTRLKGSRLGALILCLRRARAMGELKPALHPTLDSPQKIKACSKQSSSDKSRVINDTAKITSNKGMASRKTLTTEEKEISSSVSIADSDLYQKNKWYGIVDIELLRQSLVCRDEQVRLDTFALLCESQKMTEIISTMEIDLVTSFIPDNLNNQNPAFRQHLISLVKKFLTRMKESRAALKRQVKKDPCSVTHLWEYQGFLLWLMACMFNNLYPGSVFARRSTCLSTLNMLRTVFGESAGVDFNFYSSVGLSDVHSLLYCLTDTFEDNKQAAADILIFCSRKTSHGLMIDKLTEEMFSTAFSLSRSTRPQDSTTAAYLFNVLLQQPAVHAVLKQYISSLTDTSSSNEEKSSNTRSQAIICLFEKAISMPDTLVGRRYQLLMGLLGSLEGQCRTAEISLMVAATNNPLYPTLQCFRYCLDHVNFRSIPQAELSAWRLLLASFTSLCHQLSAVVSPVVCNSSPEGNVPMESLPDLYLAGICSEDTVSQSHKTVMLMPEYLIVCAWRTIKEMSLVLGKLASNVPLQTTDSPDLLSLQQIEEIGEYFTMLLLESKHRGAFELAYAGFVKLTDMLWRSSNGELHQLPQRWLLEVIHDIKNADQGSRLCATRRSAGLPFYVQALVTTEPSSTGRQCFQLTMTELLALALDETTVTMETSSAKVHALNILRALYKDSSLRDDVAPYTADGLRVAILGFKSPLWVVRNSATLLMTAMMTRMFGVKRSKDESSFDRKNCQTGRTFFFNYPSLYQFLLDEIAIATSEIASQLHPGLFPILMVLGRLFPSALEGTDTSLNLAAFIPYVIKCSASPVLKTRVMAAKALQPLVDKDRVVPVFHELLALLPCQPDAPMKHNKIHGVLLQVDQLFRTVMMLPECTRSQLAQTVDTYWKDCMPLLTTSTNACMLNRKVALEVGSCFVKHFQNNKDTATLFYQTLISEIQYHKSDTAYAHWQPGLWEFQSSVCQLFFEHHRSILEQNVATMAIVEDCAIFCLSCGFYEVRQTAIKQLHHLVTVKETDHDHGENGSDIYDNGGKMSKVNPIRHQSAKGNSNIWTCRKIYLSLIAMLDKETHSDCLSHLLRLLHVFPAIKDIASIATQQHILNKLLTIVEQQQYSDGVLACCVSYCGTVVHAIHMQSPERVDVQRFIGVIFGLTSHIETDTDILLACAAALKDNFDWLTDSEACVLFDFSTPNSVYEADFAKTKLGLLLSIDKDNPSVYSEQVNVVYRCVLDLLQTDDLTVREAIACLLDGHSSHTHGGTCQPYIAISKVLDLWYDRTPVAQHSDLLCYLVHLIYDGKQDEHILEERLFHRGEINTYWDELDFIKMVFVVVKRLAHSLDLSQVTAGSLRKLETCVNVYLNNSEDVRVITNPVTNYQMYTDTSLYERHVTSVYRAVVVCWVGQKLGPRTEHANTCEQVLQSVCQNVDTLPKHLQNILHDSFTH